MTKPTDAAALLTLVGWPPAGELWDQFTDAVSGQTSLAEFVNALSEDDAVHLLVWSQAFHVRIAELVADKARGIAADKPD